MKILKLIFIEFIIIISSYLLEIKLLLLMFTWFINLGGLSGPGLSENVQFGSARLVSEEKLVHF